MAESDYISTISHIVDEWLEAETSDWKPASQGGGVHQEPRIGYSTDHG